MCCLILLFNSPSVFVSLSGRTFDMVLSILCKHADLITKITLDQGALGHGHFHYWLFAYPHGYCHVYHEQIKSQKKRGSHCDCGRSWNGPRVWLALANENIANLCSILCRTSSLIQETKQGMVLMMMTIPMARRNQLKKDLKRLVSSFFFSSQLKLYNFSVLIIISFFFQWF
jgi:hypothetical protein